RNRLSHPRPRRTGLARRGGNGYRIAPDVVGRAHPSGIRSEADAMRPGSRTGMFALAAVVTASLGGGSARPEAPEKDKPAAVVNGETISLGEVDAVIRQRPAGLTPLSPSQQRQLRLEILAGLIDDLLLRQFLREHAPPVD